MIENFTETKSHGRFGGERQYNPGAFAPPQGSGSDPVSFPTDPTIPQSGLSDPTLDPNFPPIGPDGQPQAYTLDGNGYMQKLMQLLNYIDAHPTSTQAFIIFAKTVAFLSQKGLLSPEDQQFLDQANVIEIMKRGIDHNVEYAFLYGYGSGAPGTWDAASAYASSLQDALEKMQAALGGPGKNEYIDGMLSETGYILGTVPPIFPAPPFEAAFLASHIAGYGGEAIPPMDVWGNKIDAGDIIWGFSSKGADGKAIYIYYDWTKAQKGTANPDQDKITQETINSLILNSSGAVGNDHADMDFLDSMLTKMQIQDSLSTFFSVLKETGDVGMAILAFIYAWEGNKMNDLSGSADVMDKQHQLSENAKSIEDYFRNFANPVGTPPVSQLRGMLQALFTQIQSSSQFGSLGDAVNTAIDTLNTTMIPFPPGSTTTSRSIWDLITDPTVTNDQLQAALQQGLTPDPKAGGSSPSEALQGALGGIDGVVTAVTSASTQANTAAAQIQALIQAIDKVMTGVIDPNNGMNTAVVKNALSHQTGN